LPQAIFSAVLCVFCLGIPVVVAKLAGYDLGYAAGLYAGSQTISASLGLATDAINRLGLPPEQAKGLLDAMPVAYAVTYIFGTVGSAILLALVGPPLLRIDLAAACKRYEERQGGGAKEVDDPQLLNVPVEGVDVYVTNKAVDGKTLAELAQRPTSRGVFLRKISRGATAVSIPILPNTKIYRGDILTLVGRTQDTSAAAKDLGVPDRATDVADVAFIGGAITLGALVGALVWKIGGVPLTLSTAGGALISGLVFGWLRSTRPFFGRIPSSTVWFMNSVGLNVFIAVVGLSAGPGFVKGLQTQGISLFMWSVIATSLPLILAMLAGKFIFRFDPAILFGACAGARTTTAALGMVCERANSQVPALGYTVTYAVGNTLLTIWGMVLIVMLS